MAENNKRRVLCVSLLKSQYGNYYHVCGRIKTWHEAEPGDGPRSDWDWPGTYNSESEVLGKIVVWCQGEEERRASGFYGCGIEARDISSADTRQIVALAKMMAHAERYIDKYRQQEGRDATLGQFFVLAAKALGCEAGMKWNRHNEQYEKLSWAALQSYVDNIEWQFGKGCDMDEIVKRTNKVY